ncbi:MAG: YceI family protein [Chitinophagales bacterium]|nr:YceI family protein [Chitinophagales bacterium]
MKKFIISFICFVGFLFVTNAQTATSVALTSQNTSVQWIAKKITSEGHVGNISVQSGSLLIEKNSILSGEVVIDMNSITCTDISDAEKNQYLIEHLKNEDFFNVAQHPTAILKINSVKPSKKKGFIVSGILTIKGISQQISFPAGIVIKNGIVIASGVLTFDRTKFDVTYGSTLIGAAKDKAIKNDVVLKITLNTK